MKSNRRDFIKSTATGAAAIPMVAAALASTEAFAKADSSAKKTSGKAETPPANLVKESSQIAISLKYTHDSKKAGQNCTNCLFYDMQNKKTKGAYGPCALIAGHSVKGAGWCKSWKPSK